MKPTQSPFDLPLLLQPLRRRCACTLRCYSWVDEHLARVYLRGHAPERPHVQVCLILLTPQPDVWRPVIGRAHVDVVFAEAQLLLQSDVGVCNFEAPEIADDHLAETGLTLEKLEKKLKEKTNRYPLFRFENKI